MINFQVSRLPITHKIFFSKTNPNKRGRRQRAHTVRTQTQSPTPHHTHRARPLHWRQAAITAARVTTRASATATTSHYTLGVRIHIHHHAPVVLHAIHTLGVHHATQSRILSLTVIHALHLHIVSIHFAVRPPTCP